MIKKRILVVEDEREIRELISLHILRNGFAVQAVGTGTEAFEFLKDNTVDLIVLDWMLPDISGVEFLKKFRISPQGKTLPILMVTAKAEPEDVVYALDNGADDYIIKPFVASVLMARINALVRRVDHKVANSQSENKIEVGELKINLVNYEAFCKGEKLDLTPSEFKILSSLASQVGRVLTRDRLIQEVQGDGVNVIGRTIDTHMFALRKKLGTYADYIETIRGVGYRFRELDTDLP